MSLVSATLALQGLSAFVLLTLFGATNIAFVDDYRNNHFKKIPGLVISLIGVLLAVGILK